MGIQMSQRYNCERDTNVTMKIQEGEVYKFHRDANVIGKQMGEGYKYLRDTNFTLFSPNMLCLYVDCVCAKFCKFGVRHQISTALYVHFYKKHRKLPEKISFRTKLELINIAIKYYYLRYKK